MAPSRHDWKIVDVGTLNLNTNKQSSKIVRKQFEGDNSQGDSQPEQLPSMIIASFVSKSIIP